MLSLMRHVPRLLVPLVLFMAPACGSTPDPLVYSKEQTASAAAEAVGSNALRTMRLVNDRFLSEWPAPGADIGPNRGVPSNTWTRAVYFEGMLALYDVAPDQRLLDYGMAWADGHAWRLSGAPDTRLADDQCAGQAYLSLYMLAPSETRIVTLQHSIDAMVQDPRSDDWTWIDAIQMAMPVFARMGVLRGQTKYLDKMHALYTYTRDVAGGHGLYDQRKHLWYRDQSFLPPFTEPNGESCFWSRGNGWVYAGLARVLDVLPPSDPRRPSYEADFVAMSEALLKVRRSDGFWNVSLHDPEHFGGPEITGTSLFVYGMAWGIRHGLLPRATFEPAVRGSFKAMSMKAIHSDGRLGYVQGTARGPLDGQPVSYDSVPNYDDFAVGCFLLAGSEMTKLDLGMRGKGAAPRIAVPATACDTTRP
jgi:rhamnogalacturonyl hydrolase YesR